MSKSIQQEFVNMYKEDTDSSSGKEFQKLKISHDSSMRTKKLSISNIIKHAEGKTLISKAQSLHFKSRMVKILNRFKEVCSEYELEMEHVKWKHFKKKLIHQEFANNVIFRTMNVITKLKKELEEQENELTNFHDEWNKKCSLQSAGDGSSSTENELLEIVELQDKSDRSKSNSCSEQESKVSECDSEEIFSAHEATKTDTKKNKENKILDPIERTDKSVDNTNENSLSSRGSEVMSPVLGSNKEKEKSDEIHSKDKSKVTYTTKVISKESKEQEMNDSTKDIFDVSIGENDEAENTLQEEERKLEEQEENIVDNEETQTKIDSNDNNDLLENQISIVEFDNKELDAKGEITVVLEPVLSKETTSSKTDDVESVETVIIEKDATNFSDILDEEQAKKLLLDSDSETLSIDESMSEKSNKASAEGNTKEKSPSQSGKGKPRKKHNLDDISRNEKRSLNKRDVIKELCAKHDRLLNSDSDISMDSPPTKKLSNEFHESEDNSENRYAKALLLASSNSENSGSENNNSSKITKVGDSSKKQQENSKEDSSQDEILSDSQGSISERTKKRRKTVTNMDNFKSDEKLSMECEVVLERLPKEILKKYANALDKSRQYLDSKQIISLINLDTLQRDSKKTNDPSRNSSFPKKSKIRQETEDSLLDHLKKIENGELIENSNEDSNEDSDTKSTLNTVKCKFTTNEELMVEADRATKNILLNSSDTDVENQNVAPNDNDSDEENLKTKASGNKKKLRMEKKDSTRDKDDSDKQENSRWKRDKVLTIKFSDTDSDVEKEKWKIKQEKLKEKEGKSDTESSDVNEKIKPRKRNVRKKILNSDSDTELVKSDSNSDKSMTLADSASLDSDSSVEKKQRRTRKRKTRKSSDTDSSLAEKKSKPKRKRIKKMDSDSDDDSNKEEITSSQGTPGKTRRRNIRKVLKDKQVADDTKQAAKEEEERIKRIAERQRLYNEMYEARLASEEKVDKLVLDFNPETKEEIVCVHEDLVKRLKPHQAKGIKFMWDACFESLERTKSSPGSGCILAHCMGLGKSLQVIALAHTLLRHEETGVKTILIVCPLSTVLNWFNEFKLWLNDVEDNSDIDIYELTKMKKNIERKYQMESWQRRGGVLIIGYEMFRNLSGAQNRMRKSMKEDIKRCLIDPGPDLVVCDEGHLLKNENTALSKSMTSIRSLRRIVLTGTPLQNNLIEYHCMVQFVKPKLLGTKKEFLNRFANPIMNGQFDDSTEYDVKLMKKRAYVLHKMLKGCVQRFDYSVLTPFLPPKQEYVIFVRLSDVQIKMYRYYLDNLAYRLRASTGGALFRDFQTLQRVWTHPLVLKIMQLKQNERKLSSDSEGSLKDFIDDGLDSESTTTSSNSSKEDIIESNQPKHTRSTRNNESDVEVVPESEKTEQDDWWSQFIEPEHLEDMKVSSKLVLLFGILKECEQIGDKLLIFSQSLCSLSIIENFLNKIDEQTREEKKQKKGNTGFMEYSGRWSLGLDYFRLDGQTSAENRSRWCKIFNKSTNTRARLFLISTRAGGLGITLTAANRVIIFDASWNPSHDVQSIFRIYRFGQKKPCYVYRFLAAGTMEEKIYNRQVTKLSLSCRVVDEQQIERHYSNHDLNELYTFEPNTDGEKPTLNLPKDRLLAEIFLKYKDYVENYHEHDSLLENKVDEELDEEERKQAWLEYEEEKKEKPKPVYTVAGAYSNNIMMPTYFNVNTDYAKLQELIRKDYPNATPEYQQIMTARALTDMYSYWERQAFHNTTAQRAPDSMLTGLLQTQMRPQVPTMVRVPNILRNANVNVNGQGRADLPVSYMSTDPKSGNADDDIIEVTTTTSSKKNQEE